MDSEDGMIVNHLGVGVWRFDSNCLPTHLIYTEGHSLMTNTAFGGPDKKTLYITDSMNGRIMRATLPVAGKTLYGLS
ncbi:MAG: gluconolactonase [Alphaproteobacteria bacterium]|jgi:gluconolactonase